MTSTIFALSSGKGRTGVAVWRVSGPQAKSMIEALTGSLPAPRVAALRALRDGSGRLIDRGLTLWFPGPKSETGEDMAEFQIHGGRALSMALTEALLALGGRPAEAGEFTRRAVLNGKLDLTAAEGLVDLVNADTEQQRRRALAQGDGILARRIADWRGRLIKALGHLEALIDFSEEDLPKDVAEGIVATVRNLAQEIDHALSQSERGERLRDGMRVAIVGAPNAGKSSLLNAILGRDAAIVSEVAGTTRDVIEAHLDLGGWPVLVADTAGLRDTVDGIEAEGVRRAQAWAASADVKLVVIDGALLPRVDDGSKALLDGDAVLVVNKADCLSQRPDRILGHGATYVSALTGEGVDRVLAVLEAMAEDRLTGDDAVFGRARHRSALSDALDALRRFRLELGVELAAEELRLAARAIGRITGAILTDDLLDVVFRDFCIGK